jgi:hypothetical protein
MAETMDVAEAPASLDVAAVTRTPIRKPDSFQVAMADTPVATEEAVSESPAPKAVQTAEAPAAEQPKAASDVADASLFSGARLIVPLRRQVTLVSTTANTTE